MSAKRRIPQWVPWTVVLLLLTLLALLDPREEPQDSAPTVEQLSHD